MKATIEAQALRMLAERAARAAAPKPHIPIYSAILLEADPYEDGDRLSAKASDGQTWLRDSASATVDTAGHVAVSARLLAGLTAVLPKGVLHLEDTGSALTVSRAHSRGTDRWTLPVMHADDFPSWPADPPGQIVTVPARPMAHALDLVGGIVSAADVQIGGLRQMEITADGAGVTVRGTARLIARRVGVDLGLWVHMGRVNSYERLSLAYRMGCDSADGTFVSFGPNKNLPQLLNWFDQLPNSGQLDVLDLIAAGEFG